MLLEQSVRLMSALMSVTYVIIRSYIGNGLIPDLKHMYLYKQMNHNAPVPAAVQNTHRPYM